MIRDSRLAIRDMRLYPRKQRFAPLTFFEFLHLDNIFCYGIIIVEFTRKSTS